MSNVTAPQPTTDEAFEAYLREQSALHPEGLHDLYIETFTPRMAALMLKWVPRDGAIQQRKLRKHHVEILARSIQAGRWCPKANTILLGSNLAVYNGQHDLAAIAMAGKTVTVIIRLNCPPEVRLYANVAIAQTWGDAFGQHGLSNGASLAVSARHLLNYERFGIFVVKDRYPFTIDEGCDTVKRHPMLGQHTIKDKFLRSLGYTSLQRTLYYAASVADPEDHRVFVAEMVDGSHAPGSPVKLFREKLIKNATSTQKCAPGEVAAAFIRAWNYLRDGRQVERLGAIMLDQAVEMRGFERDVCRRGTKQD